MTFEQLKQSKIDKNVYLLKGDAFLCSSAKNIILDKLNISNINISVFNDENFDMINLINSCNQFSFFDEKRAVVISNLSKELTQDDKNKLIKYFENSNNDCVMIFIDSINANYFDFIKKAEIIECKPSEIFLVNYIVEKAKRKNNTISTQNAKLLATSCLNNVNKINLEVKKICDYLGENKEITSQNISLLVTKDTELKVFDLTNYLGAKNLDKAMITLNDMLNFGEQPTKILALITSNFRRMMFAKINKGSNAELSKALGVKEFAIVKAKEMSNKFSAKELKNILNLLLETDYEIKSGKISQINALYYVITKIVT